MWIFTRTHGKPTTIMFSLQMFMWGTYYEISKHRLTTWLIFLLEKKTNNVKTKASTLYMRWIRFSLKTWKQMSPVKQWPCIVNWRWIFKPAHFHEQKPHTWHVLFAFYFSNHTKLTTVIRHVCVVHGQKETCYYYYFYCYWGGNTSIPFISVLDSKIRNLSWIRTST